MRGKVAEKGGEVLGLGGEDAAQSRGALKEKK